MSSDLTSLVRRDHDDLDHMLLVLTDPATPPAEAVVVLESLQLAFAAHTVAQSIALRHLLGPNVTPRSLSMIVLSILDDHRRQARALAALAMSDVGTIVWITRALALRELVLDHATREGFMRASLCDHISIESQHSLASTYASERLRQLVTVDARSQHAIAVSSN